jgi:hypothetical protein
MSDRLTREVQLLLRAEFTYAVAAAPVIAQLTADEERPLPDVLPPKPEQVPYRWPRSGEVNFTAYWHSQPSLPGEQR